jgi:hypothetical protein
MVKQLRLSNPSSYYETWRDQPVKLIQRLQGDDGEYVDVQLIGDKDKGLRLRVSASAIGEQKS